MKSTIVSNQQETYTRARENPFFDGMQRGEAADMKKGRIFDLPGRLKIKNIHRSASDIGNHGSKDIHSNETQEDKNSPLDIVLEPIGRTLSGRWSKTSSPLIVLQSDLNLDVQDSNDKDSNSQNDLARPLIQRSYSVVSKRQVGISNVPLPPSAALFYSGASPQLEVVESCKSVEKLNMYLKSKREYVNAGVPGRFLQVVLGPDAAVVGSVASTIMYAFYLDSIHTSHQFCIVPVINMKRDDLDSRADLQWLLDSCRIDLDSLIFIDEIDLSYYDLFGSLKLVLVNCDKIPSEQEALKEALVEVFNCTKSATSYSWVNSITVREDASCCTVIAETFALTSPGILAGQGFSRLLLAGILLDTGNLSSPHCTSKDKYMATLLINGSGRFGCNGLYQILRYKSYGISELKVGEILRKEYKKWARLGIPDTSSSRSSHLGMSSIGMPVAQFLSRDSASTQEIINFQKSEKLGLLMIVSGYYDSQKNFKREILVSAESADLMKNLLTFLNANADQLPLKVIRQPGLGDDMKMFEIDKVTSRKTIEGLLQEFSMIPF